MISKVAFAIGGVVSSTLASAQQLPALQRDFNAGNWQLSPTAKPPEMMSGSHAVLIPFSPRIIPSQRFLAKALEQLPTPKQKLEIQSQSQRTLAWTSWEVQRKASASGLWKGIRPHPSVAHASVCGKFKVLLEHIFNLGMIDL